MTLTADAAARNNASWCDALCRSHGQPGEFLPGLWLNRYPAPRYYPNVVTLISHGAASHLERVRELRHAGLPRGWAVKDSFHALDLGRLGFRVLFEAEWIWRPADAPRSAADLAGVRWARIQSEPELADWEAAWCSAPGEERLFLPSLLADGAITFLAAYREGQIIAGAIAHQSDGVIGLSNVFGPEGYGPRIWAGSVAASHEAFPGRPLAGYETGHDLAAAQSAGFITIGPLRVWLYGSRYNSSVSSSKAYSSAYRPQLTAVSSCVSA
jgi:hypothetical protein